MELSWYAWLMCKYHEWAWAGHTVMGNGEHTHLFHPQISCCWWGRSLHPSWLEWGHYSELEVTVPEYPLHLRKTQGKCVCLLYVKHCHLSENLSIAYKAAYWTTRYQGTACLSWSLYMFAEVINDELHVIYRWFLFPRHSPGSWPLQWCWFLYPTELLGPMLGDARECGQAVCKTCRFFSPPRLTVVVLYHSILFLQIFYFCPTLLPVPVLP